MNKFLLVVCAALLGQGCSPFQSGTISQAMTAIKDSDGYCAKDERARQVVRGAVNRIFEGGKRQTKFRIDCLGGRPSLAVTSLCPL